MEESHSSRSSFVSRLKQIQRDADILENDQEVLNMLFAAAKAVRKASRRKRQAAIVEHDKLILNKTENVRRKHTKAIASSTNMPLLMLTNPSPAKSASEPPSPEMLHRSQNCYICKSKYREVHSFYDMLCPTCAPLNYEKRMQTTDLTGRIALVTGARIKIGYEICLKLLRANCARVIATTRFPRDAAARFARETDFDVWKDRLDIYGLDLCYVPTVERFCEFINSKYSHLDILINNAAMTLARGANFYDHLTALEEMPLHNAPENIQYLMNRTESQFKISAKDPMNAAAMIQSAASVVPALEGPDSGPERLFDGDGQVIDYSKQNSWKLELEQVPTAELAQVMLINSIAPFVLCARLKPVMERSPFTASRFIVNVSSMEGQFSRKSKTTRHPHTNCAKAALNMLTRTSAEHYAHYSIYMTAVDTGWVSEMLPVPSAQGVLNKTGVNSRIPLDEVDGAARVLDPVFIGINTGLFIHGKFLKDYQIADW